MLFLCSCSSFPLNVSIFLSANELGTLTNVNMPVSSNFNTQTNQEAFRDILQW